MAKVVIDANVIISAAFGGKPLEAVLRAFRDHEVYVSDSIEWKVQWYGSLGFSSLALILPHERSRMRLFLALYSSTSPFLFNAPRFLITRFSKSKRGLPRVRTRSSFKTRVVSDFSVQD